MRLRDVLFALLIPLGLWMAFGGWFASHRRDYGCFNAILGILIAILGLVMIGR
jgi:hypothetical protein